jgi:signal transduction histidine kinase
MSATASWTVPLMAGYALAIGLAAGLAVYCFLRGSTRVATAFGGCMVAVLLWSVGAFGRLLASSETGWYAWTLVMYLGVVSAAVLLFVFAVLYTGSGPTLDAGRVALLFVLPATSLVVLASNPIHGLFFAGISAVPFGDGTVFTSHSGPWFWVNALYSYVLFGAATALLAGFAVGDHRVYRRQAMLVLAGAGVPWAINVAYLFSLGPTFPVDPTPVGFAVGGGLLAYAVFRAGLADLTPVARSAVVDAVDDAVCVLDGDDRLVDLNPAAESLLPGADGEGPSDPVGRPVEAVAPSSLLEATEDPEPVTVDGTERWYRARELPLEGEGSVLLVSDVTDGVRRQRQLREQTERLEEFTRVAAHDLRNPLNAITGYAELARETGDVSHLERVPPAAERVETLIDDLLTLGREGRVVEDTAPVPLARAAEAAWENVETGGPTLEVVDDTLVLADGARFTQLLENLFRNTVEHGSTDTRPSTDVAADPVAGVGVRVGALPDGFFVADDGTGIPTERRADVFEYGYSTHGGTGLGLPVVRSIAVAHGWEVSVTEAAGGGARFEFTGVELREPTTRGPAAVDGIRGRTP